MAENITGDKMLAHIERIAGERKPITADIFLTNYCNNRCPYCTYGRWNLSESVKHMAYGEFIQYAQKLSAIGVLGYILTGGGEPTIARDFDRIAEWLTLHKYHWGINTNFNRLVFIKPDYLKVSLDGYDEKSYERARGVRRYREVRENIQVYAGWKKKNSPETSLGIQMVAESAGDVEKFYKANKDLDVDYIVFRPKESTGGRYYRDEEKQKEAVRIIEAVKRLAGQDSRVTLNFKWGLLDRQEEDCTASWAQMALNERGEVMYCCHKPYQIIGHILDDDIMTKKREAVTDMSMCDIPCRMTAPNLEVKKIEQARNNACFI